MRFCQPSSVGRSSSLDVSSTHCVFFPVNVSTCAIEYAASERVIGLEGNSSSVSWMKGWFVRSPSRRATVSVPKSVGGERPACRAARRKRAAALLSPSCLTRAVSKALTVTEEPDFGEPGGDPPFVVVVVVVVVVVDPVVMVGSRDGSVVVVVPVSSLESDPTTASDGSAGSSSFSSAWVSRAFGLNELTLLAMRRCATTFLISGFAQLAALCFAPAEGASSTAAPAQTSRTSKRKR